MVSRKEKGRRSALFPFARNVRLHFPSDHAETRQSEPEEEERCPLGDCLIRDLGGQDVDVPGLGEARRPIGMAVPGAVCILGM